MTGAAAFVVNSRQDLLATNHLGRAFFAPLFESPAPANMARFTYLDPRARDFFADWNRMARECVGALRAQVGRDPFDRDLADLVGELSTKCDEFAAHNVRLHNKAEKLFNHPSSASWRCDTTDWPWSPTPVWRYVAEPGSRSREAFDLLASWAADGRDMPSRVITETDV